MILTELVRLFDNSPKSTIVYVFIVLLPIIAIKLYSISFFKSGILLQQPIAPLEGISAHFSYMFCIILKEMRGREIFDLPG